MDAASVVRCPSRISTPSSLGTYIYIYEPEQYVSGIPYDKNKVLRAKSPVVFQRETDGSGYWAVMRHPDVMWASKKPKIFSSYQGGINIPRYKRV